MLSSERKYEHLDDSKQSLKFGNPHFPAYFRLMKYKLLDICVKSVTSNDQGHFKKFDALFDPGELSNVVKKLTDPIPDARTTDPYMLKIDQANLDDKSKKQAETYAIMRHRHVYKVQRRRMAEYFLKKVLYNEPGLRIADQIIYENNSQLYGTCHWKDLPENWETTDTFIEKFYDKEELAENPYGHQKLDRVVGAARGNFIMKNMMRNSLCKMEYEVLLKEVREPLYLLQTPLMLDLLDEGPEFELKIVDGQETKQKAEKWNCHNTRILFLSIPGFRPRERELEKNEWYYALMDSMRNDPYNRAALYFLDQNYEEELEERENERDRLRLLDLKGQRADEEEVGEVIQEIRPQRKSIDYNTDADVSELELRSYQEELVQPALGGKNCVIVAPTGSGKTEVAIYASLKHIEKRIAEKKPARVVLLVPKIVLVHQQKERYMKYCNGKYYVNGFYGSERSDNGVGRCDDVIDSHIVVMTPQILINMLQSVRRNERLYVSDFSLMIFDEVHHTTGNHAYVQINQLVQEWEFEKPQIVGLTASLNISVTAQTDESRMLDSIYEMLALLNAPTLTTIIREDNLDVLNSFVGRPDDTVELCQPIQGDQLRQYIERWLNEHHKKFCDELDRLQKLRRNNFSYDIKKFRLNSIKDYEQYEQNLQTIVQNLSRTSTDEKKFPLLYAKYIKAYIEARAMVDLMPPMVVIRQMELTLKKLREQTEQLDQFGKFLSNDAAALRSGIEDDATEPPIVRRLKETLLSQFRHDPQSRVIIFVTQRSMAQRVASFLNETRDLDEIKSVEREQIVGYVLGTNKGGPVQQTPQEQETVLAKFRNGKLKVIVATSVVEEGLDVPSCNLIIKYNCASNSAVSLVQQIGRARAKNSRSVLLSVKSSVNERQNTAIISEKYMRQCVRKIEQNGQRQLAIEVDRLKKKIETERKRELDEQMKMRSRLANKIYKMTCANCDLQFCKSTAIRKVYSNFMAFDPQVWDRLIIESKHKTSSYYSEETQPLSKLKCAQCKTDVGKAYKMRGVYLPQLDVKAIAFLEENCDTDSMETKAKWSAVENEMFFVCEATQSEFVQMLNALSNSEANMDKKRQLDLDSKHHIKNIETKKFREENEKKAVRQVEEDNDE